VPLLYKRRRHMPLSWNWGGREHTPGQSESNGTWKSLEASKALVHTGSPIEKMDPQLLQKAKSSSVLLGLACWVGHSTLNRGMLRAMNLRGGGGSRGIYHHSHSRPSRKVISKPIWLCALSRVHTKKTARTFARTGPAFFATRRA
jgi:hypothetical protein